jgi:hypothetical protein
MKNLVIKKSEDRLKSIVVKEKRFQVLDEISVSVLMKAQAINGHLNRHYKYQAN